MVGIPEEHLRIARVVGESEEGLTLFVPKSMDSIFNVEPAEDGTPARFLTMLFLRKDDEEVNSMVTWLPWEG